MGIRRVLVIGTVAIAGLMGCGDSEPSSTSSVESSPGTQETSDQPAATEQTTETDEAEPDEMTAEETTTAVEESEETDGGDAAAYANATEVAEALAAEIPSVTEVTEITEDNDPNDLIGRPTGYVSAAVLTDEDGDTSGDLGSSYGATIEEWPDAEAAQARADYIQSILEGSPMLGSEYDFVEGGFLLRLSGELKPSVAETYEDAFAALF